MNYLYVQNSLIPWLIVASAGLGALIVFLTWAITHWIDRRYAIRMAEPETVAELLATKRELESVYKDLELQIYRNRQLAGAMIKTGQYAARQEEYAALQRDHLLDVAFLMKEDHGGPVDE